ncbi:MAG: GNAT family N-acetyltransferase [Ignavibacteriaceae bacterium]|nr:GNAT family N-acetyltransferase [Ignavibacteriaceae bacterium]
MIKFIKAASPDEIEKVRKLFREYADSLEFKLDFQNFEEEVNNLPGEYAAPEGKLYIALFNDDSAGCIALRKIDKDTCEMKRLFVLPKYRGLNIGKALTEILITEAKRTGYKFMRLDTVFTMLSARRIYEEFGFKEIPPYRYNPVEGAIYMELNLQAGVEINLEDDLARFIRFNLWKHHKLFLCGQVKYYSLKKEAGLNELKSNLLQMGKSQFDIYTGELFPEEIMQSVADELKKYNVTNKDSYINWLIGEGNDYRIIILSDGSEWTLRLNTESEKYIHIHPARYSVNTLRIKASTLQTAVTTAILSKIKSADPLDLQIINEAREKYISEPPVKTVNKNSGLGKIILMFTEI